MAIREKYILVCDDVRREDNGKLILLGVYPGDMMTVPQLPYTLPTFSFFCTLESDRSGSHRLSFKLRHEDTGQTLGEGIAQMAVNDPSQPIIMPVKLGNIQIRASGLYTFSLEFEGQAPIVKTFTVQLVVPTANQPGPIQNR